MPESVPLPAYLAVDLGSSSGRVMLGVLHREREGEYRLAVSEVARFANEPVALPEGFGWDVPALRAGVIAGLADGVSAARREGASVRGIGVDSWGVDYARLTAGGLIRPFARHHRGVDAAAATRRARDGDPAADYLLTGVLDQAINTSHQLRQDAEAGIGEDDDTILLIADLFVYLLTGTIATEPSLASTTALLDRRTESWSATLAAGVRGNLPPLARTGALAGRTTPEVSELIGASDALPVYFVTAHDTAAAFSAVVDAREGGTGVVSCGSWAVVGVALESPILSERARRAGFTQEIGAGGETLLVKNLSGMWLLQQCMREWARADGREGWSIDDLRALLERAATSRYPGRFDPADPALHAPGALVGRLENACAVGGAAPPPTRADLVRAILDSLATAYARTFAEIEELTGRGLDRVRVVGGGARNELLCALTAERAGLPLDAGPVEASVEGVLRQLAVAAGDIETAAVRAIAVDDADPPPTEGHA